MRLFSFTVSNVWKSKYAAEGEESPDNMHLRLAKEFFRIDRLYQKEEHETGEWIEKLSEYGKIRYDLTEETIYDLFKDFKCLCSHCC